MIEFENITMQIKIKFSHIIDWNFPFSQTDEILQRYGDPLTIYDGSNDQSTQIAKLSGNLESFGFSSTGNSLFVKFESNGYNDGSTGFLATIQYGNSYLNINNTLRTWYILKVKIQFVILFL